MDLMTPSLLKQLRQWVKDDKLTKFYNRREWLMIRQVALRRDGSKCQYSKRQNIEEKADTVHHLVPVRDRPELALTLSNLESISKSNHNREHPEKIEKLNPYLNEERW